MNGADLSCPVCRCFEQVLSLGIILSLHLYVHRFPNRIAVRGIMN